MLPTKKLINNVENCVDESLKGAVALHPGLSLLEGHHVVIRSDYKQYKASGKVCTLTGGGSGHEPCFYGMVGQGLMTAGVHGPIFASPSSKTILAAIRILGENHEAGVLIIYNNYTGDRLHFGKAIEQARGEGINVECVIVGEDCSVMSKDKTAGRRGLAGSIVIWKVLCAMAEDGIPLEKLKLLFEEMLNDIGTLGVCLSACSLPGGSKLFTLGPDEMEIGLGLHGEAGIKRTKMMTAHDVISTMIEYMTSPSNPVGIKIEPKQQLAVFLNNLGATSALEMNILAFETLSQLEAKGHHVVRAYCGSGVTSQEMAGFSLTIFLLNDARKQALDAHTNALSWPKMLINGDDPERCAQKNIQIPEKEKKSNECLQGKQLSSSAAAQLSNALYDIGKAFIDAESMLNRLDSTSGDGDCGTTLKAGGKGLLDTFTADKQTSLPVSHPYNLLISLAELAEDVMGGSSGALYSLLLTAAALPFLSESATLGTSLKQGLDSLCQYGGAQPGDRTMIDPLHAAFEALEKNPKDLDAAVKAAEESAESTAGMIARAGRASYVESEKVTQPDPGAKAVAIWMRAALNAL